MAEHPENVVPLQVPELKYSTRLLVPSATYTAPLVVSTARAVGTEPDGSVTVATN